MIRRIPAAHIGPILIMDFSSSTLCTVFSLQRFGLDEAFIPSSAVTMAALSKNLHSCQNMNQYCTIYLVIW